MFQSFPNTLVVMCYSKSEIQIRFVKIISNCFTITNRNYTRYFSLPFTYDKLIVSWQCSIIFIIILIHCDGVKETLRFTRLHSDLLNRSFHTQKELISRPGKVHSRIMYPQRGGHTQDRLLFVFLDHL